MAGWRGGWLLAVCVCVCGAACPPCPRGAACALVEAGADSVCLYTVDNIDENLVIKPFSQSFALTCPDNVTLDSPSLPRFPTRIEPATVTLERCALPAGSYAHALARLNVTARTALRLLRAPAAALRPDHFHGLDTLLQLQLFNRDRDVANNIYHVVNATSITVFDSLKSLTNLTLRGVQLPLSALKNLKRLNALDLLKCWLKKSPLAASEVRAADTCMFPWLHSLRLLGNRMSRVPPSLAACNVSLVALAAEELTAPARLLAVPDMPTLDTLYLGPGVDIQKLNECSSLKSLTIENKAIDALPEGLVENCPQLRSLTLLVAGVTSLSAGLLGAGAGEGGRLLERLTLTRSRVTALPRGLFRHEYSALQWLDLSYNRLTNLHEGVFSVLTALRWLDLSHNQLTGGSLWALAGLPLTTLRLSYNPLGDLCPAPDFIDTEYGLSPLHSLSEVQNLSLAGTGARRLCADWYQPWHLTSLTNLDLDNNHIDTLQWTDLTQWKRNVVVRLQNNNFIGIQFNYQDYTNAEINTITTKVTFILDQSPVQCDCSWYWFARAARGGRVPALLHNLACRAPDRGDPLPFARADPEDMVCEWHTNQTTCTRRPKDGDGTFIDCSSRGLTALPDVSKLQDYYQDIELSVRNNSIRSLPETLPARLRMLDLRRNALRGVAAALLADARRRVRLAHNPLDCACARPLLDVFRRYQDQIVDAEAATCEDGRWVRAVAAGCGTARWAVWAGAGAALLAAAGGAGALAACGGRAARGRVKAWLLARGCCLRWVLPRDTEQHKYDAFLSYAQEDWEVAEELRQRLEAGEGEGGAALRVCVHHRDWQPGEWIPKQISRSVNESRRTIILLSENFARSSWARAEFREAYARALRDDAVRLLVVLLGSAPPATLDPDLRHYVANNTYLRWGEPAFWEKLRLALPKHSPPAPPPPSRPRTTSSKKPRAPRRPSPLRPPAPAPTTTPQPPTPPTPIVKFCHIDFPAPVKPIKSISPPCA